MLPLPDVPKRGSESATLRGLLDEQRALVLWKLADMSEADARASIVPSGTSVLSVVKHLAWMERCFFAGDIGDDDIDFPWTAQDPNGDWRLKPDDNLASMSQFYIDAVNESDAVIAGKPLDSIGGSPDQPLSLRFVVSHMIAETARHLGHMDILRESADGTTGYTPG